MFHDFVTNVEVPLCWGWGGLVDTVKVFFFIIYWFDMGEDWHFLWWVKRQVFAELVVLTRLQGQVPMVTVTVWSWDFMAQTIRL